MKLWYNLKNRINNTEVQVQYYCMFHVDTATDIKKY